MFIFKTMVIKLHYTKHLPFFKTFLAKNTRYILLTETHKKYNANNYNNVYIVCIFSYTHIIFTNIDLSIFCSYIYLLEYINNHVQVHKPPKYKKKSHTKSSCL